MRKIYWVIATLFLALPLMICAQPIWEVQNSGVTVNLHAVSFCNALVGTAVGDSGVIVHTTNGGKNWYSQRAGDSVSFMGVAQLDTLNAFIVGDSGRMMRTTDGGATWNRINSGTSFNINAITYRDSLHGVAVGDSEIVLITSNGGITWDLSYRSSGHPFLSAAYLTDKNIIVCGWNNAIGSTDGGNNWGENGCRGSFVLFSDSVNGFSVLPYQIAEPYSPAELSPTFSIYQSTDGGGNWPDMYDGWSYDYRDGQTYIVTDGSMYSIGVVRNKDTIVGIAVGDNISVSYGSGSSWTYTGNPVRTLFASCTIDDSSMYAVGVSGGIIRLAGFKSTAVAQQYDQPSFFSLSQNYPNPFGSVATTINYTIAAPGGVTLKIYNLLGELIAEPVSGWQSAGTHSVSFNASQLPQGVYMYQLQQGSLSETKMMLVEH
jgi:photosystem II stability/assembly factor-like uncharacterized protein